MMDLRLIPAFVQVALPEVDVKLLSTGVINRLVKMEENAPNVD